MKTCCTVVIGHVDHGKTALVHALTGTDTDQLPEEKARGLSIAPGFAHARYPGGVIDFVDAPGHADFIQGMVAGASGARAVLMVISMIDGVQAQTREHLMIAGLLGITHAVIAISKSDLVPPAEHAARLSDLKASLSQTPFADAPLVVCSAQNGHGLNTLNAALENLLASLNTQPEPLHSFLPIDRAFSLAGRGTIVTGALLGAPLALNSAVTLHPNGPNVSIRSLQSRGHQRDRIQSGERMAANLRGINAADILRGAVLLARDAETPSDTVDVRLDLLPDQVNRLKNIQDVRVLLGTSNTVAQLRLYKSPDSTPTYAQLRFKHPTACFTSQRAILRRLSPAETIGGAVVLDPLAIPTRAGDSARVQVLEAACQGNKDAIAIALCAAGKGIAHRKDIARLAHLKPNALELGAAFISLTPQVITTVETLSAAKAAMLDALKTYHAQYPLHALAPLTVIEDRSVAKSLQQHALDALLSAGEIRKQANRLALTSHDPLTNLTPDQRQTLADLEDSYRRAGLTPPQQVQDALTQLLIDTGALITLHNVALKQTLTLHRETITQAAQTLAQTFPAAQPFTTSEARTALHTSRRIIVPLLEHLDTLNITTRVGDTRQITTPNSALQPPAP